MSGGKPSPAKAAAKRKAAAAAAAAGSPGGAKKNKLEKGIGSLLARLEASNASFLQAAAATSMQTQLAKVTVRGWRLQWGRDGALALLEATLPRSGVACSATHPLCVPSAALLGNATSSTGASSSNS